jgi:ribokinase
LTIAAPKPRDPRPCFTRRGAAWQAGASIGRSALSVVVTGSINRDLICQVETLPRAGETVSARATLSLPGGKGANQAIAAARMGAAVRMLACVGDDPAGDAMIAFLQRSGVDTRGVARLGGVATGTAYITTARDGENQIVVDPGANARLGAGAASIVDGAIDGARVVLAQLETPVAATAAAFERAGAIGALRILNTAPALAEGAALFALSDLLILNQTETARYCDLAAPPADAGAAVAVRRLFVRDDQRAVVTLGAAGAVLVTRDAVHRAPGIRVPVVDTTGAGDCFCGALAALLAEGIAIEEALPLANAAAALCVQAEGAAPAMPARAAAEAAAQRYGRGGSRSGAA